MSKDSLKGALLMSEDEPRIKESLKHVKGENILNVGCVGKPILHSYLSERHSNVIGIDLDENGVDKFKKRGFNVLKMDAEDLKFDRNFDTIIAGELIEHLSNPRKFLIGCKKYLNKNGRLILTTPNPFSLGIFINMILTSKLQNPEYVCWFDKETLLVLLSRIGFNKIQIIYCPPQIKTIGENPIYATIFLLGTLFSNILFKIGAKCVGGTDVVVCAEK